VILAFVLQLQHELIHSVSQGHVRAFDDIVRLHVELQLAHFAVKHLDFVLGVHFLGQMLVFEHAERRLVLLALALQHRFHRVDLLLLALVVARHALDDLGFFAQLRLGFLNALVQLIRVYPL
jgi:hypothetical protein